MEGPQQDSVSEPVSEGHAIAVMPGKNGGQLRRGNPGNKGGNGRTPDALRAKLREIGQKKGIKFLNDLMDGTVQVQLVGQCQHCHKENQMPKDWLKNLLDSISTSTDQRLKALEQTWRYGLGTASEEQLSKEVKARLEATLTTLWGQLGYDHPVSREIARIWGS